MYVRKLPRKNVQKNVRLLTIIPTTHDIYHLFKKRFTEDQICARHCVPPQGYREGAL